MLAGLRDCKMLRADLVLRLMSFEFFKSLGYEKNLPFQKSSITLVSPLSLPKSSP